MKLSIILFLANAIYTLIVSFYLADRIHDLNRCQNHLIKYIKRLEEKIYNE